MDRETRRRFEAWRAEAPDPQNVVVDDLFAGECDRAGFIQRATMFGLGVPMISAALLAAGEAPVAFAKETRGKAGGRLRIGLTPIPKGNLEPWTYQETAALQMGGISGEFLNRNRQNLTLAKEAPQEMSVAVRRVDQLDGDLLLILTVRALGQVDGSHASVADLSNDPIRAHTPAEPVIAGIIGSRIPR